MNILIGKKLFAFNYNLIKSKIVTLKMLILIEIFYKA